MWSPCSSFHVLDDRLLLTEQPPQRVDVAVGEVRIAVCRRPVAAEDGQQSLLVLADGQSLRQPVYLRPAPDLVIAQHHPLAEHRPDLLRRGIHLLPRPLVLAILLPLCLLLRFGFRCHRCLRFRYRYKVSQITSDCQRKHVPFNVPF